MSVEVKNIHRYIVVCDVCARLEEFVTDDLERGIFVHTVNTAIRAAGYHRHRGVLLCPVCYESKEETVEHYRRMKEYKRKGIIDGG